MSEWSWGGYVLYLIKMWYSCFAQFPGIKSLAQTFPLTKIKFANRNVCLSDPCVHPIVISRKLSRSVPQKVEEIKNPSFFWWLSVFMILFALVVGDLWRGSGPGLGLFSTDSLKDQQMLAWDVDRTARVRPGPTLSLVVGLWGRHGVSGVFLLDVPEIRPPLFPVGFQYPGNMLNRLAFAWRFYKVLYSETVCRPFT